MHISGDHTALLHIYLRNIICDVDTSSLRACIWLHYPNVLIRMVYTELVVV